MRRKNDAVQFSRLLSEIRGVGLSSQQISQLCSSMNLAPSEIAELFERAEAAWRRHVRHFWAVWMAKAARAEGKQRRRA